MLNNVKIARRIVGGVSPRLLLKAMAFGVKGISAVRRFNQRLGQGKQFPAFMMISVTNRCNLSCQGCWVTATPPTDMEPELLERIITECRSQGGHFFGILGGEPLLHEGLLDVLGKFPGAYFQLFFQRTHARRQRGPASATAGQRNTVDQHRRARNRSRRTARGRGMSRPRVWRPSSIAAGPSC